MSKVAREWQHSFHSPIRELQQQRLLRNENSIDSITKSPERNVANRAISAQQFSNRTTVAGTKAKHTPESQKLCWPSQDVADEILVKRLKEKYLNTAKNRRESEEYQVYQNDKVKDFFQNEISDDLQSVADICLVNDHFILVRMPDPSAVNPINLAKAAQRREREFRAVKERNLNILKESERDSKKLSRCWRSRRNRVTKIAPILEEPENFSDGENKTVKTHSKLYCLKIQSCWQTNDLEVETYQTHTKIHKNIPNTSRDIRDTMEPSSAAKPTVKKTHIVDTPKSPDVNTISGSHVKPSTQCHVSLHKYGSLVESHNDVNTSPPLEILGSPQRSRHRRLESFYWLLRPFRNKYRKPKPRIQAVVYKTYFVKWTKPPDTLVHGYGVKLSPSPNVEVSLLRRCRSAVF